ncbi:MAG: transcription termination/antitermination NusG family protein, partial [Desulfobacterales bacterium]|nr:transcription termination/antitermination NusG family protein [Desulfobacterales bacterium]
MKSIKGVCPGLFPVKNNLSCIDYQHWYAIQTMSGREKKLVATLQILLEKIQLYLPTRKVIHQFKGTQHILELP